MKKIRPKQKYSLFGRITLEPVYFFCMPGEQQAFPESPGFVSQDFFFIMQQPLTATAATANNATNIIIAFFISILLDSISGKFRYY